MSPDLELCFKGKQAGYPSEVSLHQALLLLPGANWMLISEAEFSSLEDLAGSTTKASRGNIEQIPGILRQIKEFERKGLVSCLLPYTASYVPEAREARAALKRLADGGNERAGKRSGDGPRHRSPRPT
jgi:hypothetical protein